jgi:predicted nuclease with TOPRIM domain
METKKFDIKTWFIIILGAALCLSIWFGQKNNVDDNKDKIEALHKENETLLKKNDSLNMVNSKIDGLISDINKKIDGNTEVLTATKKQLQEIKKLQNEVPHYVNNLSANGVASAFSNYLTKSSSSR